jgi:hypothetical protein
MTSNRVRTSRPRMLRSVAVRSVTRVVGSNNPCMVGSLDFGSQTSSGARHFPSRKIAIGRPLAERTSWCGPMPNRWKMVAARSSGEQGSAAGAVPRASVDP